MMTLSMYTYCLIYITKEFQLLHQVQCSRYLAAAEPSFSKKV